MPLATDKQKIAFYNLTTVDCMVPGERIFFLPIKNTGAYSYWKIMHIMEFSDRGTIVRDITFDVARLLELAYNEEFSAIKICHAYATEGDCQYINIHRIWLTRLWHHLCNPDDPAFIYHLM
jgi:hypothetical protein